MHHAVEVVADAERCRLSGFGFVKVLLSSWFDVISPNDDKVVAFFTILFVHKPDSVHKFMKCCAVKEEAVGWLQVHNLPSANAPDHRRTTDGSAFNRDVVLVGWSSPDKPYAGVLMVFLKCSFNCVSIALTCANYSCQDI